MSFQTPHQLSTINAPQRATSRRGVRFNLERNSIHTYSYWEHVTEEDTCLPEKTYNWRRYYDDDDDGDDTDTEDDEAAEEEEHQRLCSILDRNILLVSSYWKSVEEDSHRPEHAYTQERLCLDADGDEVVERVYDYRTEEQYYTQAYPNYTDEYYGHEGAPDYSAKYDDYAEKYEC